MGIRYSGRAKPPNFSSQPRWKHGPKGRKTEVTKEKNIKESKNPVPEGAKFSCDQCNYATNRSFDLKRHIESKHLGIRYPGRSVAFLKQKSRHNNAELEIYEKYPEIEYTQNFNEIGNEEFDMEHSRTLSNSPDNRPSEICTVGIGDNQIIPKIKLPENFSESSPVEEIEPSETSQIETIEPVKEDPREMYEIKPEMIEYPQNIGDSSENFESESLQNYDNISNTNGLFIEDSPKESTFYSDVQKYQCDQCFYATPRSYDLKRHIGNNITKKSKFDIKSHVKWRSIKQGWGAP